MDGFAGGVGLFFKSKSDFFESYEYEPILIDAHTILSYSSI